MERNRPESGSQFAVQNSSGETRENLIAAISYQWAQTNPAAALAWTQDLSDPAVRDAILPSMVSAAAEDNPSATAEMISRLSGDSAAPRHQLTYFAMGRHRSTGG